MPAPRPYPPLGNTEGEVKRENTQQDLKNRGRNDRPGYLDPTGLRSLVFVYDISSRASFEELTERFDELLVRCNYLSSASPVMILGLKADVSDDERQVSKDDLSGFAASRGCLFAECSAKTGANVDEAFGLITEQVHISLTASEGRERKTLPVR
ncbi:ras-domain-containing protein [Coniochaeta ligniaria NRRL 30616]|uniref:Ras-domain-containing protein n=1 Tax=Coniochaeta ligniaria NRRL 30616 TaxID=1408157 RepID=A0A1J7JSI0_9PEZI|nr:ras-domain-containing protein [Coniochaeta ligniaria NRRL 30616]